MLVLVEMREFGLGFLVSGWPALASSLTSAVVEAAAAEAEAAAAADCVAVPEELLAVVSACDTRLRKAWSAVLIASGNTSLRLARILSRSARGSLPVRV